MAKGIKITDVAYNMLRQKLREDPESKNMNIETLASNLITTFLNAKIEWKEDGTFQITEPYVFIDLPAYLKYLETNPQAKIPLIEALRKIADATTWRKFGEALEKYKGVSSHV